MIAFKLFASVFIIYIVGAYCNIYIDILVYTHSSLYPCTTESPMYTVIYICVGSSLFKAQEFLKRLPSPDDTCIMYNGTSKV